MNPVENRNRPLDRFSSADEVELQTDSIDDGADFLQLTEQHQFLIAGPGAAFWGLGKTPLTAASLRQIVTTIDAVDLMPANSLELCHPITRL